jgi:DNA repair protein RadA/Sms
LASKDVFLNIAGGLKVTDTATDLAVICAILSSSNDYPIPFVDCFSGEVGLSGEIRSVSRIEQRISEAEKMGFTRIFISRYNRFTNHKGKSTIEVVQITKVEHLFRHLFS